MKEKLAEYKYSRLFLFFFCILAYSFQVLRYVQFSSKHYVGVQVHKEWELAYFRNLALHSDISSEW